MAGSLTTKVVTLIVYTVVARFVGIEEFGYVAFALLFVEFLTLFVGTGVIENLIRREEWDESFAHSAFWLGFLIFIAISLIVIFIGAPIVSHFYTSELADILMAMCFYPLLGALCLIPTAKLQRDFKYKQLALRSIFSSVIGGAFGIYLAMNGYGAWSLVYSKMLQAIINTVLLWWMSSFFPKFIFNKKDLLDLFHFSMPILGAEVVNYWAPRVADLITSIFLGPAAYALIDVGRKVIMSLYQITLKPLQTLSFSLFTNSAAEKKNEVYINLSALISFFVSPMILVLGLHSEYLIPWLFGAKWLPSAELMTVYSYAVFPICAFWFANTLFLSHDRGKTFFYLNIASMLLMIVIALISIQFGLLALVIGQVVAEYLLVMVKLYVMKNTLGFTIKPFVRFHLSILLVGMLTGILFYFYGDKHLDGFAEFFLSSLIWFISYYLLILVLDRGYFSKCYKLLFLDKKFA